MRRLIKVAAMLVALVGVAIQFVGPARTNPETVAAMRLEATTKVPPQVVSSLQRACYDCHSNETTWPWYSRVAPPAWLVIKDVNDGRGELNFSKWGEYNPFDRADVLEKMCKEVKAGKMPLGPYLMMHSEARLSPQDVDALCAWTADEADRLTAGGGSQ